jgi:hypothetical protein
MTEILARSLHARPLNARRRHVENVAEDTKDPPTPVLPMQRLRLYSRSAASQDGPAAQVALR